MAYDDIRASVRKLCEDFPGEYCRKLDRDMAYPTDFVRTLTDLGFLAALIPKEYGGAGLLLSAAAAIHEEIQASGGNGASCHAQMYVMGTVLRHGGSQGENPSHSHHDEPRNHRGVFRQFQGACRKSHRRGKGFRYVLSGMNAERFLIAAECVGDTRWLIEKASVYAKTRSVFGRQIGQNQGVQFPIAKAYANMRAANLMVKDALRKFEAGEDCGAEANMSKMLAPGAAARMGLGSGELVARHSRLIVVDIVGYGQNTQYRDMRAYDMLVQAESGLYAVTGTPETPVKVGVSVADIATGKNAHAMLLEALIARGISGKGKVIEVSIFDSTADWMSVPLLNFKYADEVARRHGLSHAIIYPYAPFTCRDGEIVIAIQNNQEWTRFSSGVLGDAAIANDRH